jgi:parallel beta-helix repeat protein
MNDALYVTGPGALIADNTVYNSDLGIGDYGPNGTVQGNRVFNDNIGIGANQWGLIEGNTVSTASVYGIISQGSATVENNVVYASGTAIYSNGPALSNTVYDNSTGISADHGSVENNRVYSNAVGVLAGDARVANNLIYANSAQGILVQGSSPLLINNTVYQLTGDAVRVENGSNNVTLRDNILDVQAGHDISVAPDSEIGFQSDFSDLYTTGTGAPGLWENQSFASLPAWFYELGLDQHSLAADPKFVNPAGPDGVLGYSPAAVGSAQVVDSSASSGFAETGNWSTVTGKGVGGSVATAASGDGSSTATWTFSGLTPGATYQVAATWPGFDGTHSWSGNAPFTVLDGGRVAARVRVNEDTGPSGFTAAGTTWQVLTAIQVTSNTLIVQLANGPGAGSGRLLAADAMRLQAIVGNGGADDDFHLLGTSPALDRGAPSDPFSQEPAPNGGRVDLGAYGDTPQAVVRPAQTVQVLSPDGLEKYQQGQMVTVTWRSDGLTANRPVMLVAAGGAAVDNYSADTFGDGQGNTISQAVNTSGVADLAPQAVYQSYASAPANTLDYQLPVPDGTYTLRLDFVEPYTIGVGQRVFDINLQGGTVLSRYDIRADAGSALTATEKVFTVTAAGGTGIAVQLVKDGGSQQPILSGIEVVAANAAGLAAPTASLALSSDGGVTWTALASGLPMDRFGQSSYDWTIPATTPQGSAYLIRVTADQGTQPSAVSDAPFLITNAGHSYYVNGASTANAAYTTALGNNANSGKSPSQPMATLEALLAAYALGPGDIVYVDTGKYSDLKNSVLGPQHSGVRIQGPLIGPGAVLNRGNTNAYQFAIQLEQATNVTLDHLTLTGGQDGLYADNLSGSTGLTLSNSVVDGNNADGVFLDTSNDGATLTGDTIFGDDLSYSSNAQPNGVVINAANAKLTGNTAFDAQGVALYVSGPGDVLADNTVYGSNTGIGDYGPNDTVQNNVVYDNPRGIAANQAGLIEGNTVYAASDSGIFSQGSATVQDNTVYASGTGIYANGPAVANRVYDNTTGISAVSGPVENNRVYSNAVGVLLPDSANTLVADNLIYANSAQGILAQSDYSGVVLVNNTVYQAVGNAVLIESSSKNVTLRNNILYVQAGYDIYVADDSRTGFNSNRNLLYTSTDPNAHVGFWNSAVNSGIRTALADWQSASGQDATSLSADPKFINPAGADNLLGYTQVNAVYANYGRDDNFSLAAGSPAIARGDSSFAPVTDITGAPLHADPGTPAQGSPDYFPAVPSPQPAFPTGGTAQNWRGNGGAFNYTLPFAFTFYGQAYTSVQVATNGFLQFAGPDYAGNGNSPLSELLRDARIAPLWAALRTDQPGDDIFVDTSTPNQVTFRWVATNTVDNSPANFAVTLFSDGDIQFYYGPGNTNVNATVGISAGNGLTYQLLKGYSGQLNLTGAASVVYTLQPGIVDLGAYQFQGSSLDTTAPQITATSPTLIDNGGAGFSISQLQLTFSKPVSAIDAGSPAAYELRKAGTKGFGSNDDVIYALTPVYNSDSNTATLSVNGLGNGVLPAGSYRLTVFSIGSDTIHDLSGNALDGTGAGGSFVRTFTLTGAQPVVTGISPAAGPLAGGTDVTITGANLANVTAVAFGNATVAVQSNTGTQITAISPSGAAAGMVDVTLVAPGGASAAVPSDQFTYVPAPTVTGIAAAAGPAAGGTTVVISGTNLLGATAVDFGTTSAAILSDSATQITVTSPAGTVASVVDVTVATAGGISQASPADQFTFAGVPAISSTSPALGPAAGGATVIITGTNLQTASAVDFGTTPGTINLDTATEIVVTSPAGSVGTQVPITVTTAGGVAVTSLPSAFTFVAAPVLQSLSVTEGPTTGGTVFTITGTNLAIGNVSVEFGSHPGTITYHTSTQIFVISPAGAAGAVDVTVVTAGGASAINRPADQFIYIAAPTVTGISPSVGLIPGGTNVTITGTNLGDLATATVNFGPGNPATIISDAGTTLVATSPAGALGVVDVIVTTVGGASATSAADRFTYGNPPAFTSAASDNFAVGQANSFTVGAAAFPVAALTESGLLPAGVTFVDNGNGTASLQGTPAPNTGVYVLSLTASNGLGVAKQTFALTVIDPPTFTSANTATFTAQHASSFVVTTSPGLPTRTALAETGPLPRGVTLKASGNGTAKLSGTPAAGAGGVYAITVTATNGMSPPATQPFTLTVDEPPAITSPATAAFPIGLSDSFTVTTYGFPRATLTKSGSLPSGVSFMDNGDGTATLAGIPAAGSSGTYTLHITATNGIGSNFTKTFTLTVGQAPTINLPADVIFQTRQHGSFTITSNSGSPPTTTLTLRSQLPKGISFSPGRNGTATLSGTPADNAAGVYTVTITASNGVVGTSQTLTLTVQQPPAITSANAISFAVGQSNAFTVKTSGFPAATLTESGNLPSTVTFIDNHNGTATLSGTPLSASGSTYQLSITADNGIGTSATQSFTLILDQGPTFTSADAFTCTAGQSASFSITTRPGVPATKTLTETGKLPVGVSFIAGTNGTAKLTGKPATSSGGIYALTLTASNGSVHTHQAFTLLVNQAPAVVSVNTETFAAGEIGSFVIKTTGFPLAALSENGGLPPGMSFMDNGDGTATLFGTPAAGTTGAYHLIITAGNGVGSQATQNFTLTVEQAPIFVSAASASFLSGQPNSFTVSATGTPTPALGETGKQPKGLKWLPGHGTLTLSGKPASTTHGTYSFAITATNGVFQTAFQLFTVTIG